MNRQDANDRVSRVVRISKDVAHRLDSYAAAHGLMIREVIDAALTDFLEGSESVQRVTLERWRERGKVRPQSAQESPMRAPRSLAAWQRLCSAEASTGIPEPQTESED